MIKVLRFLAICTIVVAFATSSIAWAQSYTQVDFPGAVTTALVGGPNPQGTSVGSWGDGTDVHGFTLTSKGKFTSFDPPGSVNTSPNFISPQGVIVGSYFDGTATHGFILSGGTYTIVNAPGAAGTVLSGINPPGEMSGFSCSDAACDALSTNESFVVSKKGAYTFFDPPGATSSTASTVNPSGAVVGAYVNANTGDNDDGLHGYLLSGGKYTTIDVPGSTTGTFAGGGNPSNEIVGVYNQNTFPGGEAFLLSKGVYTTFNYPASGVEFTEATGINPSGVIVGLFVDAAGNEHGFIRTS
jgi:hypothetical protein